MKKEQLNLLNNKIMGLIRQVMLINQDLDNYFEPALIEKKRQIQNNLEVLHTQRLTLELNLGIYGQY